MKTIKIIDLLNKIANGEEVPKKIIYDDREYYFWKDSGNYWNDDYYSDMLRGVDGINLNNEVEILDEEDEFEDIEEIIYPDLNKDYEFEMKHKDIEKTYDAINDLIKNQKKIIDKLKEEGK